METNVELANTEMKKPSLLGMITSPSTQFKRMKENSAIGLPLVIMMLIMAITGALAAYIGLNNPVVKNLNNAASFKIPIGATIGFGAAGGLIGGAAMFFITAAIYKIFMVFFGNDTPYMKLVAIVIYSSIITSLGLLINAILALILGGYDTTYTSLVPLVGDNKILIAIAGNFDIFRIWYYVILAMGLNIAAGLSKNKSYTLVGLLFFIGIAISYTAAYFSQTAGLK